MATVLELVTDAMYEGGCLGQAEPFADADAQLAFRTFKRMLGTWANENMMVHYLTQGTITLVAGTASYSTTLLSTGRPVSVDNVFVRLNSIDYPVTMLDSKDYASIPYKTVPGLPEFAYYDPAYADGTFYFYPVPSAAYVAYVTGRYALATLTGLTQSITLPLGYEAAIVHNLAAILPASFGIAPNPMVVEAAKDSKAWLKRTNHRKLMLSTDLPYAEGRSDIISG